MGIVLTETDAEIQAKINEAISYQINTSLRKNAVNIQSSCKSLAESWIISQPEIVSLQSGDPDSLAGLFGIPAGIIPGIVGSILAAIKDSVHVFFKPFDKDLNGNLEIRFQPSGFENLLSLPIVCQRRRSDNDSQCVLLFEHIAMLRTVQQLHQQ